MTVMTGCNSSSPPVESRTIIRPMQKLTSCYRVSYFMMLFSEFSSCKHVGHIIVSRIRIKTMGKKVLKYVIHYEIITEQKYSIFLSK